MNQVLIRGVATRDAKSGVGRSGGWWVVDVQPEGETASYPVWHFGDAEAPRRGDTIDLVGRLGWSKDRDGAWSIRIVAEEVAYPEAAPAPRRGAPQQQQRQRVGAGPRQQGPAVSQRRNGAASEESVEDIPY